MFGEKLDGALSIRITATNRGGRNDLRRTVAR